MEDIISESGDKSEVVSLNGSIDGESVNVKIQFWKPEGIFAAWRIGTRKGVFKRASRLLAEGKYANYEEDRLILGKNACARDNEERIEYIELNKKAQERVQEQEKNMQITYQSPSGIATSSYDNSNLELAPDNAVSGDCFVLEMSTWKLTDEPFYFQPWSFRDSKAVYFAWKFSDRIGMYGSYKKNILWLNGHAPAFIHLKKNPYGNEESQDEDERLHREIKEQIKKVRGQLGKGIKIED